MSHGIIEKLEDVTPTVLRAMASADNARLRTVMEAFVRHLHAERHDVAHARLKLSKDECEFRDTGITNDGANASPW